MGDGVGEGLGDQGQDVGVGLDGVGLGSACDSYRSGVFGGEEGAAGVEKGGQAADVFVASRGGDDGDLGLQGVGVERGIGAVDQGLVTGNEEVAGVGLDLEGRGGDDEVDAFDLGQELLVFVLGLQVAEQEDDVDVAGAQAVDFGLHGGGGVGVDGDVAGAGDEGDAGRGDADEAYLASAALEHGAGGDAVLGLQGDQAGLGGEVEVGGQEGDLAGEAAQERGEDLGAEVELLVADGAGVEADEVEGEGVEVGDAALDGGFEGGSGVEAVAGAEDEDVGLAGAEVLHEGGEAVGAAEVLQAGSGVEQGGALVVAVQEGEAVGLLRAGVGAGEEGGVGAAAAGQGEGQQRDGDGLFHASRLRIRGGVALFGAVGRGVCCRARELKGFDGDGLSAAMGVLG